MFKVQIASNLFSIITIVYLCKKLQEKLAVFLSFGSTAHICSYKLKLQ